MKANKKGIGEDEMFGWHRGFNGLEFQQALGVGDGKGILVYCRTWGCTQSYTTEQMKWTDCHRENALNTSSSRVSKWNTKRYFINMEDKDGSQHLCVCVCKFVCVCVCVRERERERGGKRWGCLNRLHDGAVWQEVFLFVVSWFLEGAVKGVRNFGLLVLAQEWGKADVQRREAWLKIKHSRWVCYGWLWALGKSLLLFKRGQVSPLTVWLLSKLQIQVLDAEWGPSKLNVRVWNWERFITDSYKDVGSSFHNNPKLLNFFN